MENEPKVERVRDVIRRAESLAEALDKTVAELVSVLGRYEARNAQRRKGERV